MKKFAVAVVLSFMTLFASGRSHQEIYIEKFAPVAVSEMHRSGIPASITLAQGLLESGYGRSELALKGNNHFGIKCHNGWQGGKVYHDDDAKGECFRKYDSAEESYRDHSDFLRYNDRYASLFDLEVTDYKGWAYGLKAAGYASDKEYAPKLISLIERYALHEYDKEPVTLPETPAQLEQVKEVTSKGHEVFRFNLSREMYSLNGVLFVYSFEGETYESIASDYRLFKREILRFNDLKGQVPLAPGTVVYLQAKKKHAAKGLDRHVVGAGETLRGISQRFAVKMKHLYKMNDLDRDYVLREGDILNLR